MEIKRVINIEDETIKHCNIERELNRFGIREVFWAKDAQSGIEEIEKAIKENRGYDLLLSDMHFDFYGEMDIEAGEKTMNTLRKKGIQIPVIFCSTQNWAIPGAADSVFYNENRYWEDDLKNALDKIKV